MQINEVNVIKRENGSFVLDKKFEYILDLIKLDMPVILKKLFSNEEVTHLRNCCTDIANNENANHPKDRSFGCKNYHSIYNNNPKSNVKSILHAFTFHPWNKESDQVISYFERLIKLRNILTGLPEDYALKNEEDGRVSVPTVQQYPRGGGYMQEHEDPDIGQKVIVNVTLSNFNKDFRNGGVFYRNKKGEKIYVDPMVEPGDALIFPPKVQHGVDPIDPETELEWKLEDGRWMCMAALLSIKSMNGKDNNAAGKPI